MPPKDSDLRVLVEALTSQLESMRTEMQELRNQVTASATSAPPISVIPIDQLTHRPREPQVSAPDTFSGREDLQIFMQQCELCFDLQPSRFPSDYHKIGFILSYLRGPAARWARPILSNKQHESRNNLATFSEAIDSAYGDPDHQLRATRQLRMLEQTGSAVKYAAEFQALSSGLSWNDEALSSQFYEGLKDSVKREISKDPPGTLRALITLAIRIDNYQFDRGKSRFDRSKSNNLNFISTEDVGPKLTLTNPMYPTQQTAKRSKPFGHRNGSSEDLAVEREG